MMMTGWDDDLGPWKPVIRDDKLYGRGGADDGYAAFGSLAALEILHAQGIPHANCIARMLPLLGGEQNKTIPVGAPGR